MLTVGPRRSRKKSAKRVERTVEVPEFTFRSAPGVATDQGKEICKQGPRAERNGTGASPDVGWCRVLVVLIVITLRPSEHVPFFASRHTGPLMAKIRSDTE